MNDIKKRMMKYLILCCFWTMMAGTIYGCGENSAVIASTETEESSKDMEVSKELEPLGDAGQVTTNEDSVFRLESITEGNLTLGEPTGSIAEVIPATDPESQDEIQPPTQQSKSLCGTYEIFFESDGGAELEIIYSPEEDMYSAFFSGSMGADAGSTEGFLSAYTDGTDNIWEYYDNGEFDAGNYAPSLRLEYNEADLIVVTSLDGQTFGGMQFPGFSGVYTRTAEYPMP